jgi:hypothetical protein
VGSHACEEGASALATEGEASEEGSGEEGGEAEAGEGQRVTRQTERTEQGALDLGPGAGHGTEEEIVGGGVRAKSFGGLADGAIEEDGSAVVEGVGDLGGWGDPPEAVAGEVEFAEEERADSQGVDGGTDVVEKAREG